MINETSKTSNHVTVTKVIEPIYLTLDADKA